MCIKPSHYLGHDVFFVVTFTYFSLLSLTWNKKIIKNSCKYKYIFPWVAFLKFVITQDGYNHRFFSRWKSMKDDLMLVKYILYRYKLSGIGMAAFNDSIILETCVYSILKKYFKDKHYYPVRKYQFFKVLE